MLVQGDIRNPDMLPSKRKVQRESLRQHLARLGKIYREGKRTRRTPNPLAAPPSLPQQCTNMGVGGREIDLNFDLDLNSEALALA